MTFRQFVFRNVFRNMRLYAAYFLSSLFTVGVFFTFAIFAFHPALSGENMNSDVLQGLSVAGGIIYVFSFFYVLYSMNAFLRSRKKEFAVLLMHGMSNGQIRRMIFLENMLIGFFATVLGILLGVIFAKLILLVAENVLVIDQSLYFYFPTLAIGITFVSFIILFFFISLFIAFLLRTTKIITFLKGEQFERKDPKFSIILSILAIVLLGVGYGIALTVEGVEVVFALFPVVILVTIGTYFFFSQLSILIINWLKRNDAIFWKKTNMLLFSDLAYRMKDNARAFFLVAIISTVAFSSIGTLVSFTSYLTKGFTEANPIAFSYTSHRNMSESEVEEDIKHIEETFKEYNISFRKESVTLHYFNQREQLPAVLIAPVSDYNKYAAFLGEKQIKVTDEVVIPVDVSRMTISPGDLNKVKLDEIILADGSTLVVDWDQLGKAKPDILPEMMEYYIVSDEQFEKLSKPDNTATYYHWDVLKGKEDDLIAIGRKLESELTGHLVAADYIIHTIKEIYSPIMFVGLFIGIIFFVSAGSFLYFRLYSDFDEDEFKFRSISKLGLAPNELNKIVTRQTAILFFAPIIVAIIHGAVALYALSNFFKYNIVTEASIVLGAFLITQIIYFFVARHFYYKQLLRSIAV